ncbi:MAG: beta strand repeat-containing protein, partial [Prochlorothrix sp.]
MSTPNLQFSAPNRSGVLMLGFGGALTFAFSPVSLAQVTPDQTLGAANSQIESGVMVRGALADLITGGSSQGSNLFHSFSQFNVAEGQRVYFANPDGIGAILGRVTGGDPSQILGALGVDGGADLFLLNPNGILFGENARLDLSGSFQASTAERWMFADGQEFSAVNPQAAPLLTIQPQASQTYALDFKGDILNEGNLAVGAGETLTLAGNQVTNRGYLAAPGGMLQVVGHGVYVLDGSHLSVSAEAGGGTIRVGGDYQGGGSLPRSRVTWVDPNTLMEANAFKVGDGGEIILWSDEATYFAGMLQAMGGLQGGNGGFVETSSAGILSIPASAAVQVSAPLGLGGQWLLDPRNLTLATTTANGAFDSGNPNTFTPTADDATVNVGTIAAALSAGTSVTITTGSTGTQDGTITVASNISKTAGAGATLRLEAANSIIFNPGVAINATVGALNVVLNADWDAANGGAIVLNSGSSITTNGGNITLGGGTNPGTTAAIGTATHTAGVSLNGVTLNAGTGNIDIRGQGAVGSVGDPGGVGGSGIALSGTNVLDGGVTLVGLGGVGGDAQTNGNNGGQGGTGIRFNDAATLGTSLGTTTLDLSGTGGAGGGKKGSGSDGVGGVGVVALNAAIGGGSSLSLTGSGGNLGGRSIQFSGAVTLTGDEITLNSAIYAANAGTDTVKLQPLSASQSIQVGGATDPANTLTLTTTELGQLQDGFASITIGHTNGTGTTSLSSGLTFNDAVTLRGSSFTLQGSDTATTYAVTAAGQGSVTGGGLTGTVNFSGAAHLVGGSGNDSFSFTNAGSLTGSIYGGTGTDTLTGDNNGNSFEVTGSDSGTLAGKTSGWSNIEALTGGTGGDTFAFSNTGSLTGAIDGGTGTDTLTGDNNGNSFGVTGSNSGILTGKTGDWSNIEALTGGNGDDIFTFSNGGSLTGAITGGSDSGTGERDTIDYSAMSTGQTINLGNIATIETIKGSSGSDTLLGTSASDSFTISGSDVGSVGGVSFSAVENLSGGAGDDTFTFSTNTAALSGSIVGGANSTSGDRDTIDYSQTTIGKTFNLSTFDGIETLKAGSGNDTLVGSNGDDTFTLSETLNRTGQVQLSTGSTIRVSGIEAFQGGGQTGGDKVVGAALSNESFSLVETGGVAVNGSLRVKEILFSEVERVEGGERTGNTDIDVVQGTSLGETFTNIGTESFTVNGLQFSQIESLNLGASSATSPESLTFLPGSTLASITTSGAGATLTLEGTIGSLTNGVTLGAGGTINLGTTGLNLSSDFSIGATSGDLTINGKTTNPDDIFGLSPATSPDITTASTLKLSAPAGTL